jgi:hypothetical protein
VTAAGDAIPASRQAGSSWIDWLLARLDALPGPIWVAFVGLFVVLAGLDQAVHWAAGSPVGSIDPLWSWRASTRS